MILTPIRTLKPGQSIRAAIGAADDTVWTVLECGEAAEAGLWHLKLKGPEQAELDVSPDYLVEIVLFYET